MEGLLEPTAEPAAEADAGLQARLDAAASRWVVLLCAVAAVAMTVVVGAMLLSI
jgi:hypothetical protein